MEAEDSSQKLSGLSIYQTTRCHASEKSDIHGSRGDKKKHFKIFFTFDKSVQSSRIRTHNWKGSNTFKRNQIGQNIKLGAKYCVCTIVRFKSSPQNGTVSKFKQINFTELADPMVTLKTGDAWFESLRVRGYPEDSAVFLTPFRNTLR